MTWYDDSNPGVRLFDDIVRSLEENDEEDRDYKFWAEDLKILSKDQAAINGIADLIDDLAGYGICCTGYYDPEEDRRNGCEDKYTGYYYLELAE